MVAGVKPSTVDKVWKFAKTIAKPMSRANSDGLGYAAITAEGNLFGERWLTNNHAFSSQIDESDKQLASMFGDAVEGKVEKFEYNNFGDVAPEKMVALTLHTRMATSPRGLNNTHPFVQNDTSLIHNGVIRNTTDFEFSLSTCDSEAILISYLNKNVVEDPKNFDEAAKMLKGYYACGILANTEEGPVLDMFKSNARLHIAYIKDLETWVASTDDDDIKNTCKDLNYIVGNMFTLLNGKFIRIDAVTGKEKSITKFEPSTEWTYTNHGGHHHPPYNGSTSVKKELTGTTPHIKDMTKTPNVIPWNKRKQNTEVSKEMMHYFTSGVRSCTKLSERETQETIMEQERVYGHSRW